MPSIHVVMARFCCLYFFLPWLLVGLMTQAMAQVTTTMTPDGSLGTTVTPNPDGSIHTIEGGTILGPNQFHSFDQFNVGTGHTARFTGPTRVENILSRVTGGTASMIDGTLQSDMAGANLYLLNPNGVVFGPGATLDINGSFHAATADVLRLADGGSFSATQPQQSVLTVSAPISFGFLGGQPRGIQVDSSDLSVRESEALSLIGGDISVCGGLLASVAGEIRLVGVSEASEVPLDGPMAPGPMGRIELSGDSQLDVSGLRSGHIVIEGGDVAIHGASIMADRHGSGAAGRIHIRSRELQIDGGGFISMRSFENSRGPAGHLVIESGDMFLRNAQILTETQGAGAASHIDLQLQSLHVENQGRISASAMEESAGDAGHIDIDSASIVRVSSNSRIQSFTNGAGAAGHITVRADTMIVEESARVTTPTSNTSTNRGGNIDITVRQLTVSDARLSSSTSGSGDAGHITIRAESVEVTRSSLIVASQNRGGQSGNAGSITIRADRLRVGGTNDGRNPQPSRITSSTSGRGDAGNITIEVRALSIEKDGRLTTSAFTSSRTPDMVPEGRAGQIDIRAQDVRIDDGEVLSSTAGTGRGGDVSIQADRLSLTGEGSIAVGSSNQGNGGNVAILVRDMTVSDGVISSSTSGSGDAGNITIEAMETVEVNRSGLIVASQNRGGQSGNAGSITIRADRLRVGGTNDGQNPQPSRITSSTSGRGDAGNITIAVRELSVEANGRIATFAFTSSRTPDMVPEGRAGQIDIRAQDVRIDDGEVLSSTAGTGRGGDVSIQADHLSLTGEGSIAVGSENQGNGGNITLQIHQMLRLSDQTLVTSMATGTGAAGHLMVRAEMMIIEDSARVTTPTSGTNRGGNIVISARQLTVSDGVISSSTSGSGNAGNITIEAVETVEVNTGGLIVASQNRGGQSGNAGSITIRADRLQVGGANQASEPQPSRITSSTSGRGDAGNITIAVRELSVEANGRIATFAFASSRTPDMVPEGRAGQIDIRAQDVIINRGEVLSSTAGTGRGGDVLIQTANLRLTEGGSMAADSTGEGDAGSIQITATERLHSENGMMIMASARANGGDITLNAQRLVLFNSRVTAEAQGVTPGVSDGGNITVQGEQLVLNQSVIQANAFGGTGGNIAIDATDVYLASADTRLDASSELGLSGTIEISSPVVDLTNAVTPLSSNFNAASALFRSPCVAHPRGKRGSSLVVYGRERIPVEPHEWLLSPPRQRGAASTTPSDRPPTDGMRVSQSHRVSVLDRFQKNCVH